MRRFITAAIIIFIMSGAPVHAAPAEPAQPPKESAEREERDLIAAARSMRSSGRVQFNFKELDINQFIRFMSELLGENIVVTPNVRGVVSIVSPKPISITEARHVMISALEMNGLSLQGMGNYSKVVPANAGPSSDGDVTRGQAQVAPGEQTVVQIVPLKYVKAGYVIEPVAIGAQGLNIAPISGGSGVMLSGRAVTLNRAMGIIRALDVPDSVRALKTIALQNAQPQRVESYLNAVAKEGTSALASLIAIGDERSGKVILVGTKESIAAAEKLIVDLDVPATSQLFHVYQLKNSDATVMAEQLNRILAASGQVRLPGRPAGGEGQDGQAPAALTPASVVPDVPTNSLVFTATQEQYAAISDIVDSLDVRPKQVMLRGLIAEINLTKLNSAGIDWSAWGGDVSNNLLMGGSAQLGSTGLPAQFMQWFAEMSKQEEVHYDAHGNAVTTTSVSGMGLIYAYIKMLNQYNAINVLSMPQLMCTDNVPGALQVGQVIPQLKGQITDVTNPAAMQNSYEYKDTGLILKVTPHVRSGNVVALDIEQTVEDVLSTPGSTTPITSKRLIKTSVTVANDETIILGGLIREVERTLKNRVPALSYIPIVGNLFTSSERQREKIDLMVFLTPQIIESPEQAAKATSESRASGEKLSDVERDTIVDYYREFVNSTSKEAVSQDLMRLRRGVSGDQGPAR